MKKECSKIYLVETPKDVFWSERKMDAQYKHIEFFWRNKAKYKEMTSLQFKNYRNISNKSFREIVE